MNTVADIREHLELLDDDDTVVFAVIHKGDKKLLERSIDNNVAVCLKYPMIILQAIASGEAGDPKNLKHTIFLTDD